MATDDAVASAAGAGLGDGGDTLPLPVILLLVSALILMAALLPYVEWLARRGLTRAQAVLVVMLTIVLALAGG